MLEVIAKKKYLHWVESLAFDGIVRSDVHVDTSSLIKSLKSFLL
jgi:hypothetical protein